MVSARQAVVAILGAARNAGTGRSRPKISQTGVLVLTASLTWSAHALAQQAAAPAATSHSSTAAQASQTTPTPAQAAPVLEEVTVTGSRIKRTTDFNTPTPTTVIDADTMANQGIVNVGQALNMAPANLSAFTPATTGNSPFFVGSYIPDLRGLNPYFGTRTLTLIDTERAVPTNQGDGFDLNFIPQVLVQRIDTVTGGASAAYGSGAMSGVVNIILDNKLEGGKVDGDFAQTGDADARDRHIGAAYGHGFLDNRWHFVIGGEFEKQDGLGCQDVRSWCAQDGAYYPTAYVTNLNFSTINAYATGLRYAQVGANGVFYNPGGNTTLGFNGAGTALDDFTGGTIPPGMAIYTGAGALAPGGEGVPANEYSYLMSPVKRGVITAMLTGAVTDSINFKANINWGKVETDQPLNPGLVSGGTAFNPNISADNAYLTPGEVTQLGDTLGGDDWSLSKDWTAQLDPMQDFSTTLKRISGGFDGKFGQSSWTWDIDAEYGLAQHDQVENATRSNSLSMALDSVIGPNGQPECRVTADGLAGAADADAAAGFLPTYVGAYLGAVGSNTMLPSGQSLVSVLNALASACVPVNPFGTQPLSAAAQDYIMGDLDEQTRNTQTDLTFNTSGEYFRGVGAGPFTAAAGLEWRQETIHNDEVSCASGDVLCEAQVVDFAEQYGDAFGGDDTIDEGYLETNLPLLKDEPFAHDLEFDLAARESRYDNRALYGDVVNLAELQDPGSTVEAKHDLFTYKASAIYEPVEGIRFRGSFSQDSRAPDFRELYYGQTVLPGGLYGYCGAAGTYSDPCAWYEIGNINLRPETSKTGTLGIVLTPPQLPGLQFSADWFDIHIMNAISQPNYTLWTSECKQGVAYYCDSFVFNQNYYNAQGQQVAAGSPGALQGAAAYAAGASNVDTFSIPYFNGAFYEERGVDFSLNYLAPLPDGSTLFTRLLTTWTGVQEYQSTPLAPTLDLLNQTGAAAFASDFVPAARWRGNLSITWNKAGWSVTPGMNFVGHGLLTNEAITPGSPLYAEALANSTALIPLSNYGYTVFSTPGPDGRYNYVPAYFTFSMNVAYSFDNIPGIKSLQLFTQVNNLLNKEPPFANGSQGGTNPVFYDTLGIDYRVGFRLAF